MGGGSGTLNFDLKPFSTDGTFRDAFKCRVQNGEYRGFKEGTALVLKSMKPSRWNAGERVTGRDIWGQHIAVQLANKFNETGLLSTKIKVRVSKLSRMGDDKKGSDGQIIFRKGETFQVEEMVNGQWDKFNSNGGWSSGDEIPDAVSHWTWVQTGGDYLVVDLQGHRGRDGGPKMNGSTDYYLLTDPATMSRNQKLGETDCGQAGILHWFACHTCNSVCRRLSLAQKRPLMVTPRAGLQNRRGSALRCDWAQIAGTDARRYTSPPTVGATLARNLFDQGPFGRSFGCEFEVLTRLSASDLIRKLRARGHNVEDVAPGGYSHVVTLGWKVVTDSSVPDGLEIVSPVLSQLSGLAEVVRMCDSMQAVGCDVPFSDTTCGFHVHVGAKDLGNYALSQLILFHDHAEQNGLLQAVPLFRRNSTWCKRTNDDVLAQARRGPISASKVRDISSDRYVSLNMFGRCEKYGTVEFRRHGGTVQGERASSWILTCLSMVSCSAQLRPGSYGSSLRELLKTMGMQNNGSLVKWASDFMLTRQHNINNRANEVPYPEMPARSSLVSCQNMDGVGLPSFDTHIPFILPAGCARDLVTQSRQ